VLVIKKVHVDRNSPRSSNNWRPCGDGLYEVFQAWCTGVRADAGGATAGRKGERRLALPKDAPARGEAVPSQDSARCWARAVAWWQACYTSPWHHKDPPVKGGHSL